MKLVKKLNKIEKRDINLKRVKNNLIGSGIYIYENNTNSDLALPKPAINGQMSIAPKKRFEGDSYFLSLVGHPNHLLRLIEEITPKDGLAIVHNIKENNMSQQLILDQPDSITTNGKIERVVTDPCKVINDSQQSIESPEILLNESPIEGLEIING